MSARRSFPEICMRTQRGFAAAHAVATTPDTYIHLQQMSAITKSLLSLCFVCSVGHCAEPPLLDERFELPPGFHIYRAAEPELTGGSYDIAFDGDGRLLVG